jgi:membrane fusion protein (multidrug efflux system)
MFTAPKSLLPLLLGLPMLALAACDDAPKQAGRAPTGPVEVSTVTVEPRHVALTTELPGRTVAFRTAEVRPQVSGIVQKRLFQEGSDVSAGQQLYQIDPASFQATLASANADLAKARANLKTAEAKAARYADLVTINAVAKQDYDDVIATLEQDRAQILAAQAEVDTARINLEYTKVFAPISGKIGRSSVTEGALVTASQSTSLATITQLDPIFVDVNQSSSELLRLKQAIRTGQISRTDVSEKPVSLTLDGDVQAYEQTGKLQFSEVTVDGGTGAVQLRALFPNPSHDLYPGLFVRARIAEGDIDQALLIPQRSLVRTPNGEATVWVVGADNTVTSRPVQVGPAVGNDWLIRGGLEAGDRIVTDGLQKIHAGTEVHAVAVADGSRTQAADAGGPAAATDRKF